MSSVKLWLKTLSKRKLQILNEFDNIVIYHLKGKTYNQICRVIFGNYHKNDVVLVGKTKYELPLPKIKTNFNKDNILYILRTTNTSTYSFNLKHPLKFNGGDVKRINGDVYKLWSKSYLLKTDTWDVDELFWLTFKTHDITKVKAWGIPLSELEKHPEHCERLMKAKLSYPVYVYGNSVIDGYHRLIKAKLTGLKKITYYKVTAQVLKICYIEPKMYRKYVRGKGFVVN